MGDRVDRWLLRLCGLFSCVVILGLLPLAIHRYGRDPGNARFFMGFFQIGVWLVVCGGLMRARKSTIVAWMQKHAHRPAFAFVLFSLLLASVEEAIACLATNLHTAFGDPTGQVYVTASANFFDLVFFHSVVVIVPLLLIWSWILKRYRFSVSRLVLIFGAQGALSEVLFAGMQPALFPTWLLVYGLMVWIPYEAVNPFLDEQRPRKQPGFLVQIGSPVLAQIGGIFFTLLFLAFSHGILKHPLSHFPAPR